MGPLCSESGEARRRLRGEAARKAQAGGKPRRMPHRLLHLLPRGGGLLLLAPLRCRSPAPSLLWSVASPSRGRTFSLFSIRAFAGNPGMASEEDRRSVEVRETVVLTEKEERIFGRLRDVVRHFQLGTQLRVAGGWVRDKVSFSFSDTFSCPIGCTLS
jgi:hypothetical protein